jgi:hypothetical protein
MKYILDMNQSFKWLVVFVSTGLASIVGCSTGRSDSHQTNQQITSVFVDFSQLHHDAKSNGDTRDHIWADDDNLYFFACDTRGYGKSSRNLNFNKITGNDCEQLVG